MNKIETVMKQGLEEFRLEILALPNYHMTVEETIKAHQKALLEAVLEELSEKKTTPWDYYFDKEGTETFVPLQDIETIINNSTGV